MAESRFMDLDDDEGFDQTEDTPQIVQSADDDSEYEGEYDGPDEDQGDEQSAPVLNVNGLTVSWTDPSDDGTIIVEVSGQMRTTITSAQDGKVLTSPYFTGQQSTLRKALTAVARNAATRAVSREWDRRNPKSDPKPRAARKSNAITRDDIGDIVAQAVAQALAAQAAQKHANPEDNGVARQPAVGRPRLEIGRTS